MPSDLHCPQCSTRITPYEHEVDPKTGDGACWKCGLPMEQVLKKQGLSELPPKRMSLSVAEEELASLRAELERMKAEKEEQMKAQKEGPVRTSEEYGEGAPLSYAIAQESSKPPLPVSEVEAASPPPAINWKDRTPPAERRGPGRPPTRK